MPDSILVSIIVPFYNGAKYLPQTIASLRRLDYPKLEIILVDDASTDNSLVLAISQADGVDNIQVLQHETNQGPAVARNTGLEVACGEIIAFLDVDDEWPEGSFDVRLECLCNNPTTDIALGKVQCLRETSSESGTQRELSVPFVCFNIGAAFYRRTVFQKVGVYDPQLRFGEDTDWFMRAREAGIGLLVLPQTTLYYRLHEGGMTSGKSVNELNITQVLKRSLDRRRQAQKTASAEQMVPELPHLTREEES